MKPLEVDLAVIGSGFAGSWMALIARQLGRSVAILERGQHPRFAIGESSTPLANLLWETLSDTYSLPRLRPLSKWGTWQRTHPEIACGLKRGFSFFHHRAGHSFTRDAEHRNQLLVAASPNNAVADTHWYRPDLDHFLVREAQAARAEYLDQLQLERVTFGHESATLEGERLGQRASVKAKLVIDASGPGGFLHHALDLKQAPFAYLRGTQTLFSHFEDVRRFEELGAVSPNEQPPYPMDDAAVHHVFEGGWVWVLRFNNGLVSAGVAAEDPLANALQLRAGTAGWDRLLHRFPSLQEQFQDAKAVLPFMHRPRLGFQSAQLVGPNWVLLPSAAGFVDPLLSTGFTLTLLGVARLASALAEHWGHPGLGPCLERYGRQTLQELRAVELLVAALYASMHDFERFARLSLLYFAPVSFVEIGCRLGRMDPSGSFLLLDNPQFAKEVQACCQEAIQLGRTASAHQAAALQARILRAIAPVDIIGLADPARKNWHPVQL